MASSSSCAAAAAAQQPDEQRDSYVDLFGSVEERDDCVAEDGSELSDFILVFIPVLPLLRGMFNAFGYKAVATQCRNEPLPVNQA